MNKYTLLTLVMAFAFGITSLQAQPTPKGSSKKNTVKSKGKTKTQMGSTGATAPGNSGSTPATGSQGKPGASSTSTSTDNSGKEKPLTSAVGGGDLDAVFKDAAAASTPIIKETATGAVNYTEQYIEAKGSAVIDNEKFKNPTQARLMAERGAVVVAQRNLLEMVKGVNVIGETTVQDMITTGDYVYTRVEGVVKGAKPVGPAREVNGAMEVTLRMPLYDNKNGVAAGFNPASYDNMRRANGMENAVDLAAAVADATGIVDGDKPLVFNLGGRQIDPSMFPVIFDENGKVLLDFSKIYQQTGKMPKMLGLTKEILGDLGVKKGVEIIDLIQNAATGKITLADPSKKGKVNWAKIGNIAGKVGKILLNILL